MTELEEIENKIAFKRQVMEVTFDEIRELEAERTELQVKGLEEKKRIMERLEAL